MECSPNVEHSKGLFITTQRQILRDISEGIFKALGEIVKDEEHYYEYLKVIAAYANNLRKIAE